MLTDFERQQCRDFKKRMDMAKTPEGMAEMYAWLGTLRTPN